MGAPDFAAIVVARPNLREIVAALRDGVHTLLIGPPGSGKTLLARTAAHQVAGPEHTLWVTTPAAFARDDVISQLKAPENNIQVAVIDESDRLEISTILELISLEVTMLFTAVDPHHFDESTIARRLRRIDIPPMSSAEAEMLISHWEAYNGIKLDPSEIESIIERASGSPRRLEDLLSQNRKLTTPAEAEKTDGSAEKASTPFEAEQSPATDPQYDERVATHADTPVHMDELDRRPFAEVIGARLDEVWAAHGNESERPSGAFMAHVHGPWGTGKTSVLNFLEAHLKDERRTQPHFSSGEFTCAPSWIVIKFNAWQHQRIRPPWWSLISEVYRQSVKQLGGWNLKSLWLRVRWLWWRVRVDWLPALVAIALITLALVTIFTIDFSSAAGVAGSEGTSGGLSDQEARTVELALKNVETALKILIAVTAAGAAVFTAMRSLAFGSARAAQAYTDLRNDPLRPIARLFEKLIAAVKQPVVIFIDDLDRCDGRYVVDLLEGIQTLFRTAPVTYVVAADRKWICSSFQKAYEDFGETVGNPGRPLGYLFLEKVFQISAAVPHLSSTARRKYWTSLLRPTGERSNDDEQAELKKEALGRLSSAFTQADLEADIGRTTPGTPEEQAARAAAAMRITSAEARRETEHLLQRFSALLEPNPRAMKRLVNAYGMHQATHFLEGRRVPPAALAQWTILELRWPLLADFLAARPHRLTLLTNHATSVDETIPKDLQPLIDDEAVKAVLMGERAGVKPLTVQTIREIVGSDAAFSSTVATGS